MTLDLVPGHATESHPVVNGDIVANFSRFTNDHTHTMIDEKFLADLCAGMDLDAGKETPQMRCKPAKKIKFVCPEPVCDAIKPHRMQSGVTEENLHYTACGRVPVENRINIFSNFVKHFPYILHAPSTKIHAKCKNTGKTSAGCRICSMDSIPE